MRISRVLILIMLLLAITSTIIIYMMSPIDQGQKVHFKIYNNESSNSIAKRLYKMKLVRSKSLTYYYIRARLLFGKNNYGDYLQKGNYQLSDKMSSTEIIDSFFLYIEKANI
ncbi:MAG: hypothetical protein OEZ36_09160 [Spirochaetota bacterium]|nr:hypothetical protein [Spirochaetota bacterium]